MADTQDTGAANNEAVDAQAQSTAADSTAAPDASAQAPAAQADTKAEAKEVEYTFDAPEGIELDPSQVDAFKAIAKEEKLSPEAAKKIADVAIKAEAARREAFAQQVEAWGSEIAADKELGKPESLAAMRSVIDTYGTAELKTLLNTTGMGNHPEVARFVYSVSKALSEDKVMGKSAGEAPRDAASILYPTTAKV